MSENSKPIDVKDFAEKVLCNEVVERHSLFQMQCFILAKEPTIQGKLQQCLREIKSRKRSLDSLDLEIEEQKDKLELIDLDIADLPKEEDSRRSEIKIRSIKRKQQGIKNGLEDLLKKKKDLSDELLFFCSAFDQLNRREKVKAWDDPEVQKEYWSEKLRQEVNIRLMLRQLPDIELLRTVLCLHQDAPVRKQVVKMLEDFNKRQEVIAQQKTEGVNG